MKTLITSAVLAVLAGSITSAAENPQGAIVLAKASGKAVILWQATPEVAQLVAQKTASGTAMLKLELDAIRVIQTQLHNLARPSSVTVNVLYARTGDVSPVYKVATFGGFEKLLTVTVSAGALKSTKGWNDRLQRGHLPAGTTVHVTGKLPPQD